MAVEYSVKPYFDRLGARAEDLWRKRNYEQSAFAEIAEQVLQEHPPSETVTFWDSMEFAFLTEPLPQQADINATFAQPPLTVYWQESFRIELLFWTVGLPGIHQHSFWGAFHVMHGSSLHSQWAFDLEERIASGLLLGKLRSKHVEILHKGDIRRILAGDQFIHATYHLDRPTISVVIRTNQEDNTAPGYMYIPPSFAMSSVNTAIRRRKQILTMLARAGRYNDLLEIVLRFVENTDALSLFHCLFHACALLSNEGDRNRVLVAGARRHRQLVNAIPGALSAQQRRDRITKIRERVNSTDLQFFLALLMNVPDCNSILELVRARYEPSDPIERIVRWTSELCSLKFVDPEISAEHTRALRGLLAKAMDNTIDNSLREPATIPGLRYGVEAMHTIRHHWLFDPLVAGKTGLATGND